MCNLTTGFTIDCRNSVGGIKELKLRKHPSTNDVVQTSANVVSALTTSGWYKYEFLPETASFTETETPNDVNGTTFYEQALNIMINKLSTTKRNELRILAQARLDVVIVDRNGVNWLLGSNNGMTKSGTAATGQGMGDMNGYTLVFAGKEERPMIEVPNGIYATLTA
jgi:hypothetical protein